MILIRVFKRLLFKRRLIKFFSKNFCFPHTEYFFKKRGNFITNYPVMSDSRCVSCFKEIKHMTVLDLDELNKEYNLEEKMLYFADKTAQL